MNEQAAEAILTKCEAIPREKANDLRESASNPANVAPQWCLDMARVLDSVADEIAALKGQ